ncbi:unnamed protein product [Mytilus edulis]|uniref:B box-type domain-containing protein n=1 Tax=Mytilus edulis TaxID=6550 RepID=A0A8S3SB56_MYTED|nr:unnamed protein product [Mytilus edulis]
MKSKKTTPALLKTKETLNCTTSVNILKNVKVNDFCHSYRSVDVLNLDVFYFYINVSQFLKIMESSKPVRCGPCKQDKVSTTADNWCYNCDEGLCSTCFSHHKRRYSTGDHTTIDIQTYKKYKHHVSSVKTECDAHGEVLNKYCPSHLMPCCHECISIHHSKCAGIKSLSRVVDETKIENSKESIDKEITSILRFFNKMANEKSRNITKGEDQYESITESIRNTRRGNKSTFRATREDAVQGS